MGHRRRRALSFDGSRQRREGRCSAGVRPRSAPRRSSTRSATRPAGTSKPSTRTATGAPTSTASTSRLAARVVPRRRPKSRWQDRPLRVLRRGGEHSPARVLLRRHGRRERRRGVSGRKLTERAYDTTGGTRSTPGRWFEPCYQRPTRRPDDPRTRSAGSGMYAARAPVDQWWSWNGDQVTISTDRNGDGRPDPASTPGARGGGDEDPPGGARGACEASGRSGRGGHTPPADGGTEGAAP